MTDKASEGRPDPDLSRRRGRGPGPKVARRPVLVLALAGLCLLFLGACASRPWSKLSYGGPPGPRPIEPLMPAERSAPAPPAPSAPSADTEPEEGEAAAAADRPEAGELPRVFELTRDAALVTALVNNPGLEVARFAPRIAGMAVPEELAVFDPRLTSTTLYEQGNRRLTAIQSLTFRPLGGAADEQGVVGPPFDFDRQTLNLSATLSSLFPSGTGIAFSGVVDRSDTNFTPRQYEGAWSLEVNQPLLEGRGSEVNLIALHQARNRAVQSEWQVRQAVLDLVAEVERSYWELALAQRVVAIREAGVELAAEQLALNEDLVDSGRAARSAVLSARAEQASRRADLEAARGEARASSERMLRLLNPPRAGRFGGDAVVRAVDTPKAERMEPDADASLHRALERRPEVFRDRIETVNRRLDVTAAQDALKPEVDLVAAYDRTSLGSELGDGLNDLFDSTRFDRYRLVLEVEVPLVGRGELARYRSARLSELRAEALLEDTALRVAEEVRRAVIGVETEWARVEATAEAVASREEELRIERERYEAGEGRNLDVLAIQRLLVEARVAAATATVRYLQALTDLDRAEGTLLEERGIALAGVRPDPQSIPGKKVPGD